MNQRAVALTGQGQYEEAAALFLQALRLSPNDEVIRWNLSGLRTRWGHEFLQMGALDQAQGQYQAALELSPNESAALLGLGDIQLRRREPRIAAETYRRARVGDVPTLDESPYTIGSVAIGYLVERYGMTAIQQLLRRMGAESPGFPGPRLLTREDGRPT